MATKDKILVFKPDGSRSIEYYVHADFTRDWDTPDSGNSEVVLSRELDMCSCILTVPCYYVVNNKRKQPYPLQKEVAPFINLLTEINGVFPLNLKKIKSHCKHFKDNNRWISLVTEQKFSPRTKHIALKYHRFGKFVKNKTIDFFF